MAEAANMIWLYPAQDGLTFYYQDTVDIMYESTSSLPYLGIYCTQGVGQLMQQSDIPAVNATATLTTPITLDLKNGTDLQSTDVDNCWFSVRESFDGEAFNGHSWKYIHTSRNSGPSTLGISISTTSTSSSTTSISTSASSVAAPSTTSATTSTSQTSQTPTETPSPSSRGLSAPASIGIGVAAGIVAILAVLAAVILIRRYWRRQRGEPQVASGPMSQRGKAETASAVTYEPKLFTTSVFLPGPDARNTMRQPVELDSVRDTHVVELHG
ncbi:hypothetical protein N0V93_002164 [Gnomoniopsis smithogilvyi]|uniref:Uncharacterized protein n=1 Tax=Gnomoniopsis smithogilvyi TaxID=1191159 RepID=A0A9W8YY84_9PEZI|nr:hypothetical protein N0V93_002164 [Gnomoniopsis smithogilvyi]